METVGGKQRIRGMTVPVDNECAPSPNQGQGLDRAGCSGRSRGTAVCTEPEEIRGNARGAKNIITEEKSTPEQVKIRIHALQNQTGETEEASEILPEWQNEKRTAPDKI